MAKSVMSKDITSGRWRMKLLKRVNVQFGDREITLYESKREGKSFTGTAREALLFAWGFGTDQAAELRYEMAKMGGNKKTADVLKAEGENYVV